MFKYGFSNTETLSITTFGITTQHSGIDTYAECCFGLCHLYAKCQGSLAYGATTFSITTLSIITLSIITLSITTLGISVN